MGNNKKRSLHLHGFLIAFSTFFIAILASFISQKILDNITSLILAFILLALIILLGVLFDIIGVAVTVASDRAFHAKAAKRVPGARQALGMIRNSHVVASFANDVVGDISGTLSGAIGAVIVLRLLTAQVTGPQVYAGTVMTAIVAALTVGGKAIGKSLAIERAEDIIFQVGKLLFWWERIFKVELFSNGKRR
ncbi:hypothetical protein MFMK1_002918 [Metallumcola ferriviriculae]|uniref:CNNM transmembrane domain-containing protein n=1 Tax=Metallumcola ferriviriculae TaxID=3039180 RepID=A0AAU0US40_9FIRM|nr:hypothetical protein MFMK1_002918 [Desulfitibacteraceae bacterium MK1]